MNIYNKTTLNELNNLIPKFERLIKKEGYLESKQEKAKNIFNNQTLPLLNSVKAVLNKTIASLNTEEKNLELNAKKAVAVQKITVI